jgi:DNA invertase Pin-like site-specific DNA recombinase
LAIYGYLRVSTVEQVAGLSLEEQRRRIHGVAMSRGAAIDQMFVEGGVTGSRPLESRPLGRELCAMLQPGDTVIVAKLDRAFRNAADALSKAEAWRRQGIKLIVADMGSEPVTDNGVAKMFFGMLALVAEFERDRLLERTNEGRRAKKAVGGHIGGSAPFGYRVVGSGRDARLVEVPEFQAAIRTIQSLRGRASLRQIVQRVRAAHRVRISHEGVRRILSKPD